MRRQFSLIKLLISFSFKSAYDYAWERPWTVRNKLTKQTMNRKSSFIQLLCNKTNMYHHLNIFSTISFNNYSCWWHQSLLLCNIYRGLHHKSVFIIVLLTRLVDSNNRTYFFLPMFHCKYLCLGLDEFFCTYVLAMYALTCRWLISAWEIFVRLC